MLLNIALIGARQYDFCSWQWISIYSLSISVYLWNFLIEMFQLHFCSCFVSGTANLGILRLLCGTIFLVPAFRCFAGLDKVEFCLHVLFSVYVDDLVRLLRHSGYGTYYIGNQFVETILYADDITLLSGSCRGLQRECWTFCRIWSWMGHWLQCYKESNINARRI